MVFPYSLPLSPLIVSPLLISPSRLSQANQADSLPHIRSLCLHEMVARAFKHILRAAIAAASESTSLPAVIAATLNAILGEPSSSDSDKEESLHQKSKLWANHFVKQRFDWDLEKEEEMLRKPALLRSLCLKVNIQGLKLDFQTVFWLQKSDSIFSLQLL